MTEQDKPGFATLMLGLGETYGEPVSDVRMEIYYAALADLTLADVRKAATLLVRTSKFFPRPAEIREVMTGSPDDRAELAWNTMRDLVFRIGRYGQPSDADWPDEATRRAALELFGGWKALCDSLPAEGPEFLGCRKAFLASYRAYDGRVLRDALPASDTRRELSREEARAALATITERAKAARNDE